MSPCACERMQVIILLFKCCLSGAFRVFIFQGSYLFVYIFCICFRIASALAGKQCLRSEMYDLQRSIACGYVDVFGLREYSHGNDAIGQEVI